MKVSGTHLEKNISLQRLDSSKKPAKSEKIEKKDSSVALKDTVEISSEAKELFVKHLQNSKESGGQAKGEDEVRQDKIKEVRKKIDSGAYNSRQVSLNIAEKLMGQFGLI